jgi:dihydrofolate reductase
MRSLIASQLMTLDGFFEGPNGEFVPPPWNHQLDQYGDDMLTREVDTILYGRRTFEFMRSYWTTADPEKQPVTTQQMNALPKVVVSRTLPEDPGWNARTVRDVATDIAALKREPGKSIVLYGSATLMAALVQHDLIDEYAFVLNPMILGAGSRLFRGEHARLPLRHVSTLTCDNGVLLVRYTRDR